MITDRTERMENKERTGDDGQDRENGEWMQDKRELVMTDRTERMERTKRELVINGQDRENERQRENW